MKVVRVFIVFMFLLSGAAWGQSLTQTVRGSIIDFDTKVPVIGAKIMIVNVDPILGAISDENGEFRIENVPVGRIQIVAKSIGYQEINIPNLLIESGKEKVMNLEMIGDLKVLTQVEVSNQRDKSESINKMATVSAKTFTVEETNRYAGSLNDPARMVSGFAGVVGDAEGENDIVVRGNSPRGILWRLEGVDIPNPNHFAGEGSTGGPVNALNGSMLANSDFFSGAFAPEYGNALSGVFDVKLRQGNNEQREYAFSIGVLGIDGTVEGPFKKGYRGSYLANYRYSSVGLLDKLGILDFDGIPIYQDASFKFVFPTKKAGTFSLIGLGGMSEIIQTDQNDVTEQVYAKYDVKANLGVVALKHTYILNKKTYLKSYVSASTRGNSEDARYIKSDSTGLYLGSSDKFTDNKLKAQTIFNFKSNRKNTFQAGATWTHLNYDFLYKEAIDEGGPLTPFIKSKGDADMMQSFLSWKYRINNSLTLVSGLHHTHFFLNNNKTVEPRVGMKWQKSKRHDFSAGFGMHSKVESASTYLYNELQEDGSYLYPNRNMDFSKSMHFVVGYGAQLTDNLRLKSEVYYQHLYNLPVSSDSTSSFSLSNMSGGIPGLELVNEGTGRNYGVELTLERFFINNFYFLTTASIYKSQYTALDGVERNSRFDANYAGNFLAGKEFKFGANKNKTFGINTKVSLIGGNRYTPIDLEASRNAGYTIRNLDERFGVKGDDIFTLNLGVTYRVDKKKASHSFKIDVQNVTNNQARVSEYYNPNKDAIDYNYQLSMIPNIIYTIKF